jgi:hypothetical protein
MYSRKKPNILKYEDVKVETQRMWNVKTKVTPQKKTGSSGTA